jgi:hypothetical protein
VRHYLKCLGANKSFPCTLPAAVPFSIVSYAAASSQFLSGKNKPGNRRSILLYTISSVLHTHAQFLGWVKQRVSRAWANKRRCQDLGNA